MKNKNSNYVANRLVKAFLKNKIINPISSKYTKKLSNADKLRKLCESKIKKPIAGFKAGGTGIPIIKKDWLPPIVRKALKVASDICVFTNNNITMEKI